MNQRSPCLVEVPNEEEIHFSPNERNIEEIHAESYIRNISRGR